MGYRVLLFMVKTTSQIQSSHRQNPLWTNGEDSLRTYHLLLLAIFCCKNFGKKVSVKRVFELRIRIQNEIHRFDPATPDIPDCKIFGEHWQNALCAKT
jgi:hypothetical protein